MPLVWTIHVQSQNGNTQIHIKIIPMEQADSACGFRLPGENFWWRKICRLHMALRPFPGLDLPCFRPPIAAMFCRSTPFFSDWTIWQHPSALLSIYSSTFQRSFFLRDFIPEFVLRFSCRQSLLQSQSTLIFQQACRKEVLDTNISPKFGRMFVHVTPHCRSPTDDLLCLHGARWRCFHQLTLPSSGRRRLETWEKGTSRSRHKKKKNSRTLYSVPFIMGKVSPDTARSAWLSTNVYSKYANTPL